MDYHKEIIKTYIQLNMQLNEWVASRTAFLTTNAILPY